MKLNKTGWQKLKKAKFLAGGEAFKAIFYSRAKAEILHDCNGCKEQVL